ncbi:MAG: glycosyltransferase, partial [Bacteroidia bacterium]|nr:glycosyltransferase [Bacteroidia bacterium]
EVIPCCADLNHFSASKISEEQLEKYRAELQIQPDDFIITYLGSIGTWYLPTEMLQFFRVLSQTYANAKFLFITPDSPDKILSVAQQVGVSANKIIIRKAQRAEVPALLLLGKLSIFFIKPSYSKKASSPTKHAEILSMGIPVIANANIGDTDWFVEQTGTGILLREFNEKAYSEAVNKIPALLQVPASRMREVAEQFFSLQSGVEIYQTVYQKLLTSQDR